MEREGLGKGDLKEEGMYSKCRSLLFRYYSHTAHKLSWTTMNYEISFSMLLLDLSAYTCSEEERAPF